MPLCAFRILFTTKDTKSTKVYRTKRLMPSLSYVTLILITGEPRSHSRRQHHGIRPKKRRKREYAKLTDQEVAAVEKVVRCAFAAG
jgi:hypothetical protein